MAISLVSNKPASVVMSACATKHEYFSAAVESVLNQTFSDFEFIIVDDGLSCENRKYLACIDDDRIRLMVNKRNLGQSRSVNKAILYAEGEFVIRMDADDIMLPSRVEIEVSFMRKWEDVLVAGALARRMSDGRIIPRRYPDAESLEMGLLFACDMVHPTMVIRREAALAAGLHYDENQLYAQDYMLWASALELGRIALIPEIVLEYRVHPDQITCKKTGPQLDCASKARAKMFARLNIEISDEEYQLLSDFVFCAKGRCLADYEDFLTSLRTRAEKQLSDKQYSIFERELSFRIIKAGMKNATGDRMLDLIRSRNFRRSVGAIRHWSFYAKAVK